MVTDGIKSMQLYPRPERIFDDIAALGYAPGRPIPVEVLNQFDQLHYHGVEALDAAILACDIKAGDRVLEVGSGWGGCARYIANQTGAAMTAVELQSDYDRVARELTQRTTLGGSVDHVNADFLELDVAPGAYRHAVSWLALFHIPRRPDYLAKLHASLAPGGNLFVEDLYLIKPPDADERADFDSHLFPNSLVAQDDYFASLAQAGFATVKVDDMTQDWTDFTNSRLDAFRDNRAQYVSVHGEGGYHSLELFYTKMAGYFSRGLVGGLRLTAQRAA